MAEILTESFCERCGTRYTFQAAAPRRERLGKFKVLSKGLRKYVLDDSTTLDEAFAEARSDEEREISSHQVEAFHQTFNFCLTCRQYTCANCWNEAEGRCLTCAPSLSQEILPTAFPTLGTTIAPAPETNGHDVAPPADLVWPTVDLRRLEEEASDATVAEAPATVAEASETALEEPLPGETDVEVADEAFDSDIAARLDALAGPAAPSPTIERPETLDTPEAPATQAPQAAAAETPDAIEAAAVTDDESEVPSDVLEAVRAKAAADQAAAAAADLAAHDAAPAAPTPPPAARDTSAGAEPPPLPTESDPADRAAAAAARTAWLLSQLRPATDEEPPADTRTDAAAELAEQEPPAAIETPVEDELAATIAPESPAAVPAEEEIPAARDDEVASPAWSIVAPIEPEPTAATPPLQPAAPPEPVQAPAPPPPAAPGSPAAPGAPADVRWPTPAWPSTPEPPPVWARPAAERTPWPQPEPVNLAPRPHGGANGLWAESSREVLSPNGGAAATGVQACINCGLPLSATARFCRRCGSSQAAS